MDGAGMFAPLTGVETAAAGKAARVATKTPIIPVPSSAPAMRFKHPTLGEPSRCWPYHDADAQLVGYVCRWNFTDDDGKPAKDFLPITYCDLGNGWHGWRARGIPEPRPLFGLPDILSRADAPVIVAEGEKTRDAAAALFPDAVATTPAHGAKSPQLTDFGPLAGRVVVIATDHDEPGRIDPKGKPHHPGRDFGDKVAELCRAAGAAEVRHLHPAELGVFVWHEGERHDRSEDLADGFDLADAVEDGWTAERIPLGLVAGLPPYLDAAERRAERIAAGEEVDEPEEDFRIFRNVLNGVEKRHERKDKDTGETIVEWRWFCSPLEIEAETRSALSDEWGRLLVVTDRDGVRKEWAMPMSMLAGDGVGYRERLLSLGLIMAPGKFARDALHEFVSMARPQAKARCVSQIGWQGELYIEMNSNFGAPS